MGSNLDLLLPAPTSIKKSLFVEECPPALICEFSVLQQYRTKYRHRLDECGPSTLSISLVEDATANFMISGGYNVGPQMQKVAKRTLIIWGEDDRIVSSKLGVRLQCELENAIIRQIPDCGHLPHVEKPNSVAKLITEFVEEECYKEAQTQSAARG